MQVYVYVDGFNLYYRALKGTSHKWINLLELAKRILDPGDTVVIVRYFAARLSARSGDPDAPRRQQIFLNALETIPEMRFTTAASSPKQSDVRSFQLDNLLRFTTLRKKDRT